MSLNRADHKISRMSGDCLLTVTLLAVSHWLLQERTVLSIAVITRRPAQSACALVRSTAVTAMLGKTGFSDSCICIAVQYTDLGDFIDY